MNQQRGIDFVELIELTLKEDHRGWLAEILRKESVEAGPFGHLYITTAHPGKRKGNHYHTRKTEWFCVVRGSGKLLLEDVQTHRKRAEEMGDERMLTVKIPPGVAHAIENTGEDMMYLIVYCNERFDPADPDTLSYILE